MPVATRIVLEPAAQELADATSAAAGVAETTVRDDATVHDVVRAPSGTDGPPMP